MFEFLDKMILCFMIISLVFYKLFAKDEKTLSRYIKLLISLNISWLFPFIVLASINFMIIEHDLSINIANFTVYINSVIIFLCFQYLLYKNSIETKIKISRNKNKDNT